MPSSSRQTAAVLQFSQICFKTSIHFCWFGLVGFDKSEMVPILEVFDPSLWVWRIRELMNHPRKSFAQL
ncbi:hypothetical protein VNO77_22510 [Canavalia gladiata]|uniref:Uncharacterized protein n=1 Tax=Canavalia gladiata TaxID=3824 RepID=A0AAN9L2R5_CANGL